jgi:APA family basic amino acid/polyamine antiporter
MAAIAGLTPIGDVAELVNIGTLAAFFLVCIGVIVLRYKHPDLPRPFRTPFSPLVPLLGAASCFFLMVNLPLVTWLRFGIWMGHRHPGVLCLFLSSQCPGVSTRETINTLAPDGAI